MPITLEISSHAQQRLIERFNVRAEDIRALVLENLKDAIFYKQAPNRRLIIGGLFVMCVNIDGEGNHWIVATVMEEKPFYFNPGKPRDCRGDFELKMA